MTSLLFFISTLIIPNALASSTLERKKGEPDIAFVERVTGETVNKFDSQTNLYNSKQVKVGHEVLIAFTDRKSSDELAGEDDKDIVLNIFIKSEANKYLKVDSTSACEVEGGEAIIPLVFYVNVDQDPASEVGILCDWPAHKYAECADSADAYRFFKLNQDNKIVQVTDPRLDEVIYKIEPYDAGEEVFDCRVLKYKSAKEIKDAIQRIRF